MLAAFFGCQSPAASISHHPSPIIFFMAITRPKGTQDHLPEGSPGHKLETSAAAFRYLSGVAQEILERSGAKLIHTPLFEEADLVKRGVGGSTDIVRKEMFTVFYQGEHGGYILRPEGTAAIVRAYLENGLKQLPLPLKLWTYGPMFRAERQQRGRLRQFHQLDYEVIGSDAALVDAEAIALMWQVVERLGLKCARIKLGSIGDPADRERYNAYLRETFTPLHDQLSQDSQDRLTRNPMRILDSKAPVDQELMAGMDIKPMLDFLGDEARSHFEEVQGYLRAWNIPFDIDPSIVRGLDYYRRTAWELHHDGVGAKSALGGGGRYDGLAQELGAKDVLPGIGWALGMERLLIAMQDEGVGIPETERPTILLAALDAENVPLAAKLALELRATVQAEFAYRPLKMKQIFTEAERKKARYVGFIGSEEAANGTVSLKNLDTGEQRVVAQAELVTSLNV